MFPLPKSCTSTSATSIYLNCKEIIRNKGYKYDRAQVDSAYHNIMQSMHPDKCSKMPQDLKDLANSYASFVSTAYNVITNDIKRAEYLLKNNFNLDVNEYKPDQQMLIKYYTMNEQIEDGDKSVLTQVKNEYVILLKQISEAFEANNGVDALKLLCHIKMCKSILLKYSNN